MNITLHEQDVAIIIIMLITFLASGFLVGLACMQKAYKQLAELHEMLIKKVRTEEADDDWWRGESDG